MLPSAPTTPVPGPPEEVMRLDAVRRSGVLGSAPEAALDDLVRLAQRLCDTKSAEINLVDADALWFLAARGLGTPGTAVDRAITFCTWTVMDPDRPLFVPDARSDERFSANPFVLDGTICSYAGFPLVVEGQAIGTMCVHDPAPGQLTEEMLDSLRVLAGAARTQLALTRHVDVLSLLARTDPLTGAANRRAIDEAVEREFHRAVRSGAPVALAMLDMDRFKRFNDSFGHPAGDLLLQRTAATWREQLRATDLLGRWGGEEFCVLFADCTGEHAAEAADRLRGSVPDEETCSIGVAGWDREESPAALVARADAALYDAKRSGRDRTVLAR